MPLAAPGGCKIPVGKGSLRPMAGVRKLLLVATSVVVLLNPGCCGTIGPYTLSKSPAPARSTVFPCIAVGDQLPPRRGLKSFFDMVVGARWLESAKVRPPIALMLE